MVSITFNTYINVCISVAPVTGQRRMYTSYRSTEELAQASDIILHISLIAETETFQDRLENGEDDVTGISTCTQTGPSVSSGGLSLSLTHKMLSDNYNKKQ
jgi:hypothetical protein